jgi:WD40 repeat protein
VEAHADAERILRGHTHNVNGVAFSPDGETSATCSDDKTARVWQASSGDLIRELKGHTKAVWGVAFSPDGEKIATCSHDQTARVWHASS